MMQMIQMMKTHLRMRDDMNNRIWLEMDKAQHDIIIYSPPDGKSYKTDVADTE